MLLVYESFVCIFSPLVDEETYWIITAIDLEMLIEELAKNIKIKKNEKEIIMKEIDDELFLKVSPEVKKRIINSIPNKKETQEIIEALNEGTLQPISFEEFFKEIDETNLLEDQDESQKIESTSIDLKMLIEK